MDRTLIDHYYRCFNERRLADAAALFSRDAEVEMLPGLPARGAAGYLQFTASWLTAFPNAIFTVQRIENRSDTVREIYLVATGRHRGMLDFGQYRFKPTGADALLHVRELLDVRDGQILTSVLTVDLNDLVNELSAVDYKELAKRIDRICTLRTALADADDDIERRHQIGNQIGVELDAARRVLRPHFYR